MFYNLLNYGDDSESRNKTSSLKAILDEVQPDILMVCELETESASNYLYDNAIVPYNNVFQKANFINSGTGLNQMIYYDGNKLILTNSQVITTDLRDINHYTFIFNTQDAGTNPIQFEVFVTHLKASRGTQNRLRRLSEIEDFVQALNNIPSNSMVLFAGDFNFYTSNEEGYQLLLNSQNPIQMIDPVNRPCPTFPSNGTDYFDPLNYNSTYFWNNSSFADIHSQSTRTSGGSGAGGGMDDRFDFIMMSENFNSNTQLFYIEDSYKTIGNNGNCYNSFVSNSNCDGTFSQSLRDNLWFFSDHLPVLMEIETPANTLSTTAYQNPVNFHNGNLVSNEIELSVNIPNINQVYIYNQLGQEVFKMNPNATIGDKIRLNVAHLSQGLYFLRTKNQQTPLKFIKQ